MLTQVARTEVPSTGPADQIIYQEQTWFDLPTEIATGRTGSRIWISRYTGHSNELCVQNAIIEPDCHVVGIALRPMNALTVFAAGKLIQSGPLPLGSMRVHGPGLEMRGIFKGAYDLLHLHVPNAMIAELAAVHCGEMSTVPLITDHPIVDPVIERLACALIDANALGGAFGQSYANGISLAIIARLFGSNFGTSSVGCSGSSRLPKWRLKRAIEYIEANLAEPIGLTDIAAVTGLSRMHFAAQFRVATGLRPHEYLLRQRISRAQQLLLNSRLPLVEIALGVGFKNQAHFTTVFGRFVGETPNVWRQHNDRNLDGFAVEQTQRQPASCH
jgi:AraC family transcriptional regulator